MIANGLIDKARIEIKLGEYGVAQATALADPGIHVRVQDYRRQSAARMMPLDKDDIRQKIPTAEYHVSRKVDGEFTVLVYRGGQAFSINPGGTIRVGLPWLDEAASLLSKAKVKEALIAGELYVAVDERRPRVHDVTKVARQPQSDDDLARLRFAAFDVISLDDAAPRGPFADTWKQITRIFGAGQRVHPVEAKWAASADEIGKQFHEWVEEQDAEGLVVRSDTAGLFKIKPRHTLDAAVIGFTESIDDRQGMLHDLLLAVMRGDGTLQVLSRVGGGFSDDQRRELLSDLKDMVVDSEYAEVNRDHVAYQMVQPSWVVEISCLDLISQTTRGGPVNRMVLEYQGNGHGKYNVVSRLPLAAVISPQFVRRREDKRIAKTDIRIEQVSEIVDVPLADRDARQMTLPASELLRREVYTKELKGEIMVRKFVLWQTNKELDAEHYPAYVVHYTDFSPNRKDALSREVRVSSSLEQIHKLWDGLKEENVKKGWNLFSSSETPAEPRTGTAAAEAQPPSAIEEPSSAEPAATKTTAKKKMAPSERAPKKSTPRKKKSG
jgi:hypothetical protein